MKAPSLVDRVVKVCAFLTDERFGYDYWQAKQVLAPADAKPALLLLFESDAERDAAFARHQPGAASEGDR